MYSLKSSCNTLELPSKLHVAAWLYWTFEKEAIGTLERNNV